MHAAEYTRQLLRLHPGRWETMNKQVCVLRRTRRAPSASMRHCGMPKRWLQQHMTAINCSRWYQTPGLPHAPQTKPLRDNQGFFHAWYDDKLGSPGWVMADCLYGQVWAYTMGFGPLMPEAMLRSHLKMEQQANGSPLGLIVVTTGSATGGDTSPNSAADDAWARVVQLGGGGAVETAPQCAKAVSMAKYHSIWNGGSPDWSALQIRLGMEADEALLEAKKVLDHWRSVLHDQWNTHGITAGERHWWRSLPHCVCVVLFTNANNAETCCCVLCVCTHQRLAMESMANHGAPVIMASTLWPGTLCMR